MIDYKGAGVDITAGRETVRVIKKHAESTFSSAVLRGIGSFGGAFDASELKKMENPVLVGTIDGVGTKTLVAAATNKWSGIGEDIVNHSANDIACQGAAPLFFLDYLASSALSPDTIEVIAASMARSCKNLGCALIGGETAEMPGVYTEGAHDVAGAMVGAVDRKNMITGEKIRAGDALIALPSNGLHTNGYSLARKILPDLGEKFGKSGITVGEALLKPHTCYLRLILELNSSIGLKGAAHITGGGIAGNLSRIIPDGLGYDIDFKAIKTPPIFSLMRERGNLSDDAMFETFNMGVGMVLAVSPENADAVLGKAEGGYILGKIV